MEQAVGEWRKLHNGNLQDFYSPPNIMVIKLQKMRRTGHMAYVGRREIPSFVGKT
jgi:hypothetical protein